MAKRKRRRFTAEFKAEVVFEALSSEISHQTPTPEGSITHAEVPQRPQYYLKALAPLAHR